MSTTEKERMPLVAALEVLRSLRDQQIVLTTMGAAREWPKLSQHALDLHYIPSAMGGAPPLGLGLALAKPKCEVIVINGDGAMLMNLGSLVTIVASGAMNLTVVVLDNGVYEVTGGQKTAAAAAHAPVDLAAMAAAAGIPSVRRYQDLETWRREAPQVVAMPGPRFIVLSVDPVAEYQLKSPGPMAQRLDAFRAALAGI